MLFTSQLNPLTYLSILLLSNLAACSSSVPSSTPQQPTSTTSQAPVANKPVQPAKPAVTGSTKLPEDLMPTGMTLLNAFSHDFNADGVLDWVVVAKQDAGNGFYIRHPFVHLSQANGHYKQLVNSPFESAWTEKRHPGFTVKLVGNDLLIISGPEKQSELPPTNGPNEISIRQSYLFHFTQGDFVLQQYTHGSTFVYQGKATHDSRIYDIPKGIYRGSTTSDTRCDFAPNQECNAKFGWNKTVANYPTLHLSTFKRFDSEAIRELSKATE
ncbi:MAG TPA: hypothetical protein PLM98_03765 [Thiolinea sp.]|nr:hypothetical protein [Thiolinea sp.]